MAQTNGTTNGEGTKSLDALTQQLSEEVGNYKDTSGNAGLLQRKKILNAAKQIIDEVKEPGETPFEYSISVCDSIAATCRLCDMSANVNCFVYRWRRWEPCVCSWSGVPSTTFRKKAASRTKTSLRRWARKKSSSVELSQSHSRQLLTVAQRACAGSWSQPGF